MNPILKHSRSIIACAALASPFTLSAQQTVFNDTFGGSTIGQASTNSGSATVSATSYDLASGKVLPSNVMAPGHFSFVMTSTSAGYEEAQAVFANNQFTPITLATPGDAIEFQYVFTDTANVLNGKATSGASCAAGLFYSGGVLPLTNLAAAGLTTGNTTNFLGGVQNWVGYRGNIVYGAGASANSVTYTRPAQNQGNGQNQALVQQGIFTGGVNLGQNGNTLPALTVGSQYTVDFKITLGTNSAGVLALFMTNILYAGNGISGAVLAANNATASGANILTTNFDAFVIGREATGSVQTTNDINQVTITATLAAQAGPYFTVTGGAGCGGVTVGLDGSATANAYLLYTNGVYNGQSVAGTGSAISFGLQTAVAQYTVVATNMATAASGAMWGRAIVSAGAPVFLAQPASVTCATNSIANFTANVSGSLLTFQWYKNGLALTNGGDIAGAQTANLTINPAKVADAAPLATGYYLVASNFCGFAVTSANAALTLIAPNHLVWQGGNPDSTWDIATTLNFTNSTGAFEAFTNGDYVTFDDSSPNTSVTLVGSPIVSSLVNVTGSQSYTLGGTGSIGGSSALLVNAAATLTLTNINNYVGGTVVSNSATLNLGDGTTQGKVTGLISVYNGATLHYFLKNSGDYTLANSSLAGNGSVVYEINNGSHTLTLDATETNTAFLGITEIKPGTRLQVTTPYGLPGTNILVDYGAFSASLYLNGSSITSTAAISITGRGPASPVDNPVGNGALRLNATWAGPITLAGVDGNYNVTTISAAGGAGTITGTITDNGNNYELEYYGGTLQIGPASGVNTYGDTRIAESLSGSNPNIGTALTTVVALNTNAFSTNVLHMNGWTLLKLNGNSFNFNNLIDESIGGGYDSSYTNRAPLIQNGSTNAAATLTVGGDNNSQSFYGVFGDGASKSLNVTKAGSGTLTLTGDSTNTGTVMVNAGTLALAQNYNAFPNGVPYVGSGSFSNAAVLAVVAGATLDVSQRSDDTLTLNANQTLQGGGTVNGNLVAGSGSTINPGDTIGALTITGNATLGGTLLLELNRSAAPATNDSLVVAGTLTAGGTLTVANVGPALHVGDAFALFGTGISGFASVNLPANDAANNVAYTWNNTLSTDGRITVASVAPATPAKLFSQINGTSLVLSWSASYSGYTLEVQTNGLNAGLGTNWVRVAGSSSVTSVTNTINAAKGSVFYRLVNP